MWLWVLLLTELQRFALPVVMWFAAFLGRVYSGWLLIQDQVIEVLVALCLTVHVAQLVRFLFGVLVKPFHTSVLRHLPGPSVSSFLKAQTRPPLSRIANENPRITFSSLVSRQSCSRFHGCPTSLLSGRRSGPRPPLSDTSTLATPRLSWRRISNHTRKFFRQRPSTLRSPLSPALLPTRSSEMASRSSKASSTRCAALPWLATSRMPTSERRSIASKQRESSSAASSAGKSGTPVR